MSFPWTQNREKPASLVIRALVEPLIKDFILLSRQKGSAKLQSSKVLYRFGENDFLASIKLIFSTQSGLRRHFSPQIHFSLGSLAFADGWKIVKAHLRPFATADEPCNDA
ncbi:hypothetical protein [Rhizobium sp. 2MFCol3.1]|uniref:hypothetical protein n=1 Tax=Rhizobium sp. 2MFCol3.1 TaxID=1246459 RepID=UPI00039C945B|nr:hypothetical protein [Rhizobium sp. 2MFCol3.1]